MKPGSHIAKQRMIGVMILLATAVLVAATIPLSRGDDLFRFIPILLGVIGVRLGVRRLWDARKHARRLTMPEVYRFQNNRLVR